MVAVIVRLTTPRLVLRRFTMDDVDVVVDLDSDPEVMFHITGGIPTSRTDVVKKYLPSWMEFPQDEPGMGLFAAEQDGDFIGWFHLYPDDGHPYTEPELGYRLRREAWGQGLATEGSLALIDSAFGELGATSVLAKTLAVHAASRRVMEKCGMRVNRYFRGDWPWKIPGDEHGDVEYVIDRVEWSAASARRD